MRRPVMGDYPDKQNVRDTMKNQFKEFTADIINTIVKPKLQAVFAKYQDRINSRGDFLSFFNEEFGYSISMSVFQGWMDQLGVRFERTVRIIGLELPAPGGLAARPAPASAGDQEEFEVKFANESPTDFVRPRGYGDAFGELQKDFN
jgi:hypothetical protein